MAKGITDRELRGLCGSPPAARVDLKDGTIDGLTVRAGPRGRPTWSLRFRIRGAGGLSDRGTAINGSRYHRVSLGTYPDVSIRQAREQAAAIVAKAERGENPLETFEEQAVDRRDTIGALVDDYVAHAREAMRSWKNAKWTLERHLVSAWAERPAGTISERDARKLIETIRKGEPDPATGAAISRNGAAAEVCKWGSMLFRWAEREGRAKANPFANVPKPKLKQRQRFLSMEEARAVWTAASDLGEPWTQAVRLLTLTGCREMEVCGARWAWIDEKAAEMIVPPEHYKSQRHFLVCLSPEAVRVIRSITRWNGGDFIFSTTNGVKPIAGIPRKLLDRLHYQAEASLGREIARFTLHDLRRTLRTHMSRLKVDELVAELVLGHALKGLQRVYNVHSFVDEKRKALELWSSSLTQPIDQSGGDDTSLVKD